jgi:hypothetical protein
MHRVHRSLIAAGLLALVVALGFGATVSGQQPATPQSKVESDGTRTFPASIHAGSCSQLGDTVYALAPVGLPEGGQLVGEPAIPAYESVSTISNAHLDDLANGGFVIPISRSESEIGDVVACGTIGGVRYGNNLLFSLGPTSDTGFAATVKITEDQQGITVTIDLIINPDAAATPAAASPAASPGTVLAPTGVGTPVATPAIASPAASPAPV